MRRRRGARLIGLGSVAFSAVRPARAGSGVPPEATASPPQHQEKSRRTEPDLVPRLHRRHLGDAHAVDVGAVARIEVSQRPARRRTHQPRVSAGHSRMTDQAGAVPRTSEHHGSLARKGQARRPGPLPRVGPDGHPRGRRACQAREATLERSRPREVVDQRSQLGVRSRRVEQVEPACEGLQRKPVLDARVAQTDGDGVALGRRDPCARRRRDQQRHITDDATGAARYPSPRGGSACASVDGISLPVVG